MSDGEHVYVYFGKTGALAFDLDGKRLWQRNVGTESGARGWGSASSPILYDNLLIVTASSEIEAIVGLEKRSCKEVWRQEAAGLNSVWGTPILVKRSTRTTMGLFRSKNFNPVCARCFAAAVAADLETSREKGRGKDDRSALSVQCSRIEETARVLRGEKETPEKL